MSQFIKEYKKEILENPRITFDLIGLVKESEIKSYISKATNEEKYRLVVSIGDKTGTIGASIFDPENIPGIEETLAVGNLVKISNAVGNVFNDNAQFNFPKVPQIEVIDPSTVDMTLYQLTLSPGEAILRERLEKATNKIEDDGIRGLVQSIQAEPWFEENFWRHSAAAKVHHAENGELAFHTISMMDKAVHFFSEFDFDRDLVIAGAFLHDLGKIYELSYVEGGYGSYTAYNLIGHIVLSSDLVLKGYIDGYLTEEQHLLLRHMVLSHHGKEEYGSPIKPQIPEAIILHRIDQLDADIYVYHKNSIPLNGGEVGDRVFPIGVSIYKTGDEDELEREVPFFQKQ